MNGHSFQSGRVVSVDIDVSRTIAIAIAIDIGIDFRPDSSLQAPPLRLLIRPIANCDSDTDGDANTDGLRGNESQLSFC